MRRLATPRTALVLALLIPPLVVISVVLAVLDHSFGAGDGGSGIIVPGLGLVGFVVARRQPRNPIGWSFLGAAVFLALDGVGSSYSVLDYRHHHGRLPFGPVAVLVQPSWAPAIVFFALSILLFPDGKLPSGWWRVPVITLFASGAIWLAGAYALAADVIASHDIRIDPTGNLVQGLHPAGNWAWWGASQDVFFALVAVVAVSWLVGQIPAYRRATGVRRAQLKLLLAGAATAIVGGAIAVSTSGSGWFFFLSLAGTVGMLGLPTGIAVGILRYRLYDIDRLISRTLSYALLTGLLVGVFVGLVLLTTHVLPFSSPVGVAASTLLAAALFSPLRNRLQRLVDRRFNRARYDTEATVAAFGSRLRDAADPETVLSELAAAAGHSLQPAHVSVWVRAS
jgi:hypothetical protein